MKSDGFEKHVGVFTVEFEFEFNIGIVELSIEHTIPTIRRNYSIEDTRKHMDIKHLDNWKM